jgi:hypothetical protein
MDISCAAIPCPVVLNATCVFYEGETLVYTGINSGDNLQTALQKIDAKFEDAGLGYVFVNGIIQTAPGQPVGLGGSLINDTTIGGEYTLTFAGSLESEAFITTGGTSSQFVKGDGSLDNGSYQPAGNYITALTGDGTATGPGSVPFTLATVNATIGTFGTSTRVPVITVNGKGLVTNITTTLITVPSGVLIFVGDVTGSGVTGSPVTLTLNPVNANIYGSNTFLKFAVNGKGLVTSATPVTSLDIIGALGYTPVPSTRTLSINGISYDLSANRSWSVGTLTSVALTMPVAFTVSGSPLTGAGGTIGVVANGTASQYIKGDGSLGNFYGTGGTAGSSGTSGVAGDRYRTTSTSTFTLGGAGTLTVGTGLAYSVAQSIIVVYNGSNFQECEVISYNALTGVLVFGAPTRTVGSGTYSSWTVNLDGASGGDGSSGSTGSSGSSGSAGSAGTSGTNGTSGSDGSSASSGSSGSSSTSGSTGTSGSDGSSGSSSTSGTTGTSGSDGTSASSGTSALDGTAGTSSTSGSSGTSGSDGTSATSGSSATSGTSALDGTSGSSSTSGTSGSNGTSASSGTSALDGTSGTTGTSGSSASSGSSGTSAADGTAGSSSTSGTSGSSGTSAIDGTSGTSGSGGTSASSGSSSTSGTSGTNGTSGIDGTNGSSATSGSSSTAGSSGTSGSSASSGTSATSGSSGTTGTSGVSGISGGQIYWMNQSINTSSAFGSPTYKQLSPIPSGAVQQTVTTTVPATTTQTLVTFATDTGVPGVTSLPAGNWSFTAHFLTNISNSNWDIYYELWKYTIGGVSTLLGTTNTVPVTLDTVIIQQVYADSFIAAQSLNSTDRLYVNVVAVNTSNQPHDIIFYTEGSSYYSYVQTTFNAPSGSSGTAGTSSTSGTSGSNGTSSTSGSNGTSGTNGTSGSSSTSGTNGTSSTSGTNGTSASSGSAGTSGSGGTSASSGTSALDGTAGTSGSAGISGTSATAGTSGATGSSGASGTNGTSGSSATSGVNGSAGTSSTSGTNGTSGGNGSSGTSGINGTAGSSATAGTSGATGSSGATGTSGSSGTSSSSGPAGSSGTSSTAGSSGPSGSSGTSGGTGSSGASGSNGSSGSSGSNAARNEQTFTATAGQTTFSIAYTVGQLDVYYNGSKLAPAEFTATNGTSFTLSSAAFASDIVNAVAYITGAGVGGSGTTNYISKFTGSTTLGNSLIWDNGTNVAIGNTNTSYTFDVTGTGRFTTAATIGSTESIFNLASTNKLQLQNSMLVGYGTSATFLTMNLNYNSGWKYISNGLASIYSQDGGDHTFYTSTSSTAGAAATLNEKLRITNAGNVGIGTTSPTGRLMLYQSSAGNVLQNIVSNQGGSTQAGINFSPSMTDAEVAANPAQASIYATDSNYGANIIFATKATGAVGNALTTRLTIASTGAASFSSTLQVGGSTSSTITIGDAVASATDANLRLRTGSTKYAWLIASQNNVAGFEITPSTTVGGTTFSTPALSILPTGAATFSSSVTAVGNINLQDSYVLNLGYNQAGGATLKYNANGNLDITPRGGYSTIFTAGNVGIGTTSPVDYPGYRSLHLMGASSTSSAILYLTNSTSSIRGLFFAEGTSNRVTIGSQSNHDFTFLTNDTERMRITSGGQVQIKQGTDSHSAGGITFINLATNNWNIVNGGDNNLYFGYNTTSKANINSSTGVYTPLSDSSKKKDFELSTIGLNAILGLKPTLYRMKSENDSTDKHLGFIAQEVKEFIPQAYSESKIGNDKFIGLDYQAITSALVKAVQELSAKNEALIKRIEQLENK